ncbi:carbohydrate sulfotransferase 8-like [Eucyclogobius newberryi]|uniref:carbohydrate sulfotransferase 8-like n=1 Tax=Eucyclogobius newberryi TaxID=166745 RepID=UPI003B59299A
MCSLERTAPPAGHERTAPPAGHERTAPPAGHERTAPPAGHERTAPPAGHERTAPPAGHERTAPPAGHERRANSTTCWTRAQSEQHHLLDTSAERTAPPAGHERRANSTTCWTRAQSEQHHLLDTSAERTAPPAGHERRANSTTCWTRAQSEQHHLLDTSAERTAPPADIISEASFSPVSAAPRHFKPPVTKRHRKLLLKRTYPALYPAPYPAPYPASYPAPCRAPDDRALAAAQESRQTTLRDVCSRYQPDVSLRRVSQRQVARVFVEDRHRLLYCEVPKSGCSNWKRVLMVLSGRARTTLDIPHDRAHYANKLRRLETYDRAGIAERLATYARALFVREPFERLVSAFRDKFESPNSYYHPVFGRPIISKYRANATRAALRTGAGVTFREFVRYLLDVKRPVGMDVHWEPVTQMCSPCLLRYSFIGKFENLEEEANFLLRKIEAPKGLTFPHMKDRNPLAQRTSPDLTRQYFAQLDAAERQKLYDFYFMDYLMFDYPKPFSELH